MNSLRDAIDLLGGQAAVAKRFEIPYRTIQNWYRGERTPPAYVAKLITSFADDQEASQEAIDDLHFNLLDREKELQEAAKREDEATRAYLQDQEWIREQEKELDRVKNDLKMVESALEAEIEDNERLRERDKAMQKKLDEAVYLSDTRRVRIKALEMHVEKNMSTIETLREELNEAKNIITQKEKFIKSISHHIP